MRLLHVTALALATCIAGCGVRYVTRGADLYAGGRYIEAAEVFERTEPRLDASAAAERARYGLYRGATLLALGDAVRAEHWLNFSREIVNAESGALSPEDRAMLDRAFGVLASRRPVTTQPPEGAEVASSQSFPAWAPRPAAE